MASAKECNTFRQEPFLSSHNLSSPSTDSYPFPGAAFLDQYQEWMDNAMTFQLPEGERYILPDVKGLDHRYDFLISTFDADASTADIHGAYGEIMGGIILHAMVQRVTQGEYTVIPTPPQLDITRRRLWQLHAAEKTGDLILGKIIQRGNNQVIEPIMLFDIKSYSRGPRTFSHVGTGINVGLTPLPVGIIYLGDLELQSQDGSKRSVWEYLEEVIHPAVLNNSIQLRTLWPENTNGNPQHKLFRDMCGEVLLSCLYTREKVRQHALPPSLEKVLLSNIAHATKVFDQVQEAFAQSDISAA